MKQKIVKIIFSSEVGKVIGGTKGNKILEYVSLAPNKATVIEEEPNVFDYDQLTKYGYGVSSISVVNKCQRNLVISHVLSFWDGMYYSTW